MSDRLLIRNIVVSAFETNCYIVSDPTTRDAIVIDPGDDASTILAAVRADGLTVHCIVDTHGHVDHIAANGAVQCEFGCPIMIHALDAPALTDANLNLSALIGGPAAVSPCADRLLQHGDEIVAGGLLFKVIHTPGHTPGGICLLSGDVLFAGDTLFAGSIGRSDFPGGSHDQLIASIHGKLLCLPDDTVSYSGHGPKTTIGRERASNPWLRS